VTTTAPTPSVNASPGTTASGTGQPVTTSGNDKPAALANPNRFFQLADLKTVDLRAGDHVIHAWMMDTAKKREEGMMFLQPEDVRSDQGMIFVFPDRQPNDGKHGFWMHNTPLPLDIIYIGANHRVINVGNGRAFTDDTVPPKGDYQFVLELKGGTGKMLGIGAGTEISIPKSLKTAE
jgi:uncharacterized membrane protein (UPF0127 family)